METSKTWTGRLCIYHLDAAVRTKGLAPQKFGSTLSPGVLTLEFEEEKDSTGVYLNLTISPLVFPETTGH